MPTPDTRSSFTPLEAGYARLSDKIDALRRLVIVMEVEAAIVLLTALGSLL